MDDAARRAAFDAGYGSDARLSDPQGCGEDLSANLDIAVRLAPVHCRGCMSFHSVWAVRRVMTASSGVDSDRREMVGIVRGLIARAAGNGSGPLDLVIPGSADTGILATCVHAASLLGEATLLRLRFTVLDLCETPLAQCRAYAARHGLAFRGLRADFADRLPALQADIVVLHSILPFLPFDRQVGLLVELREALRPGGRILVSNRLRPDEERFKWSKSDLAALARAAQARGEIRPDVPVDAIFAMRGDRPRPSFDHATADGVREIFAWSGLRVESEAAIDRMRDTRDGERSRPALRIIATLCPTGA